MIAPQFPFAPVSGSNDDRSRRQELSGTNCVWDGSHQEVGRSSMPPSHMGWGKPPQPVQPVTGGTKGLGYSRHPGLVKTLTLSNFSDRPAVLEVSVSKCFRRLGHPGKMVTTNRTRSSADVAPLPCCWCVSGCSAFAQGRWRKPFSVRCESRKQRPAWKGRGKDKRTATHRSAWIAYEAGGRVPKAGQGKPSLPYLSLL